METRDLEKALRDIGKERLNGGGEVPDIIRRRQDEVYASLADLPLQSRADRNRRSAGARIAVGTAAAAIIVFLGGWAGAMVSPAMAESLKNMPLLGGIFRLADDLGLRTAEERGLTYDANASVTREGITLRIPQVVYDGVRLSLAIKRDGTGLTGGMLDFETADNGEEIYAKGTIASADLLVDGAPIRDYSVSVVRKPTPDPDAVIFEATPFSGLSAGVKPLPDRFVLTINIKLEGVAEPFAFELPIHKNTNSLTVSPQVTREWGEMILTLERLQFTPITTNVSFSLASNDKESRLMGNGLSYELWDDRGRELGFVGGAGSYGEDGRMMYEFTFDRFLDAPKAVTFKVFLPEMEEPGARFGRYKLDSQGNVIKHYLKELEITVPVDRAGLEKLYDDQGQHDAEK